MITSSYAVYIRLIRMNSKLLVVVWCLSFSWNIMVQINTDSNVFIKKIFVDYCDEDSTDEGSNLIFLAAGCWSSQFSSSPLTIALSVLSFTCLKSSLNFTITAVMLSHPVPSPIVSGAKQCSNS